MAIAKFLKYHEDSTLLLGKFIGDIPISGSLVIPAGGSIEFKNALGFTVVEITENGDIKYKGALVKLE